MLVGDVRWATTGFGASWKLSGGSMWSSGVTNVSKKRQVRRATELYREGPRQIRLVHLRQNRCHWLRFALGGAQEPVGQDVGLLPCRSAAHYSIGQSPQVLHQHDPQRDRDRPELADGQRLHSLVGAHEPPQHLRVVSAVGMRDESPGEAEDARISFQRSVRELRKLAVEAGWKIALDLADLLIDDVKIVDQPLGRRRDRTILLGRLRQRAIGIEQNLAIVPQSGGERVPGLWPWCDPLCGREGLRMLFETLDAEELGTDRRLAGPERVRRWVNAQAQDGQLLRTFPLRQRRDRALWQDYR
jgi:hypothetical protein